MLVWNCQKQSVHSTTFCLTFIKGERTSERSKIESDFVYIAMHVIKRNIQFDWTKKQRIKIECVNERY